MAPDLSGRQIFLKAFVRNLIINSRPKNIQMKTEDEKIQQVMPMDFDKNIAQYLRGHIPSLEKQNNTLKTFPIPQIKDIQRLNEQEIENNVLSNTKEEEDYEFREIRFPRANIIKEMGVNDENKMQIGEITLEKVPLQKEKELLPMEPVNKPQVKPLGQKIQPMKPGMQIRRPLMNSSQIPIPRQMAPRPNASIPVQKSRFLKPSVMEKVTILGLAKLDQLLQDPNVQNIECPGPNKPVLIYKSGAIQPTNIVLSTDEIEMIMKEISDKTRIPLTTGIFKAALHRFLVTAVLSEFVGTRFIIQKKAQVEE